MCYQEMRLWAHGEYAITVMPQQFQNPWSVAA